MATDQEIEDETKLTAPPGFALPSLDGLTPGTSTSVAPTRQLEAVYFDTDDLRLTRAGASLRHRSDGGGGGWTVKLPDVGAGDALHRREVAFDGPAGEVPPAAASLVRAFTRGGRLVPVARITTVRRTNEVHDRHGRRVLEIADDTVIGEPLVDVDGGERTFREVEIELHSSTSAARKARRAAVKRLVTAGCAPSSCPKIARVLGVHAGRPADHQPRHLPDEPSLAALLHDALARSVAQMVHHDPDLRLADEPEDVHQFRVATRRLRSDLRTFRAVLEDDPVRAVRDELRWLGDVVGRVRDLDVLGARLRAGIRSLDAVDAPAATVLESHLHTEMVAARAQLREALDGDRYVRLLDALVALAADPPVLDEHRSDDDVRAIVVRAVRRPWKRLRDEVRSLPADAADAQLHHVRILAKRTRYAAEAASPLVGRRAKRFADAVADLQGVLGEHQDTVVLEQWLRRAASLLPAAALVAGRLIEQDHVVRRDLRARWFETWEDAAQPSLRRWMR